MSNPITVRTLINYMSYLTTGHLFTQVTDHSHRFTALTNSQPRIGFTEILDLKYKINSVQCRLSSRVQVRASFNNTLPLYLMEYFYCS